MFVCILTRGLLHEVKIGKLKNTTIHEQNKGSLNTVNETQKRPLGKATCTLGIKRLYGDHTARENGLDSFFVHCVLS